MSEKFLDVSCVACGTPLQALLKVINCSTLGIEIQPCPICTQAKLSPFKIKCSECGKSLDCKFKTENAYTLIAADLCNECVSRSIHKAMENWALKLKQIFPCE